VLTHKRRPDDEGSTVPSGLDERLVCDHGCFVGELPGAVGISSHLQEMYGIGWRLTSIQFAKHNGVLRWYLYFERPAHRITSQCDETYDFRKRDA
jgi:hypothetical protein